MNEDRELLELAALAAGMAVVNRDAPVSLYVRGDGCKGGVYWNPLSDDGDALRLAVIVGSKMFKGNGVALLFADNEDKAVVFRDFENIRAVENATNDPLAATRRAVVRGAAEIGKKMKEQDK